MRTSVLSERNGMMCSSLFLQGGGFCELHLAVDKDGSVAFIGTRLPTYYLAGDKLQGRPIWK